MSSVVMDDSWYQHNKAKEEYHRLLAHQIDSPKVTNFGELEWYLCGYTCGKYQVDNGYVTDKWRDLYEAGYEDGAGERKLNEDSSHI